MISGIARWIVNTPNLINSTDSRFDKPNFKPTAEVHDEEYTGNRRLGFIYQHACQRLFESSVRYDIVAEEIQLNDNGRTLGAIDFILRDLESNLLEHLEVAVKFYLLKDGLWYGPNAKDRLDLKLRHMLDHQLPMSQSDLFKSSYPEYADPEQKLLLQGRLYVNPFDREAVPVQCEGYDIDTSQISGYWCYESQIHLIKKKLYLLSKPEWITGESNPNIPYSGLDGRFEHCIDEAGKFWFIVNKDWPQD